jgi:GNAT superfamily N-acetyltransferase
MDRMTGAMARETGADATLGDTKPAENRDPGAEAGDTSGLEAGREAGFGTGVTLEDKQGYAFLVRPVLPGETGKLLRFYEDFEPKREAHGLPPLHPVRIHSWVNSTLAKGFHLLALRDGELIGHAFVVPTEEPGIGEYAIFLRADSRSVGVGTAMNRVAVETAREAGWKGLWLTVEPRNRAAVRSYENAGFRFVRDAVLAKEVEMRVALQ